MSWNVSGNDNAGFGFDALHYNITGSENTAVGSHALDGRPYTTSGDNNTAVGFSALSSIIGASGNAALGANALFADTTGEDNAASGASALYSNTTGNGNTASGYSALYANTSGDSNTASGHHALSVNTTGYHNTGDGAQSLYSNTTGSGNTAIGLASLYANTTGSNNIALGVQGGYNLTSGSNNIEVGNKGVAGESGAIRVGTTGTHTAVYVAGISSSHVTGATVVVTSSGQLGVLASSGRYKTNIEPIGRSSRDLKRLRPVSFHLKSEPQGALQYGLIAEEVARVYPDLVVRDEDGSIQGVRYDELAPLLLNELQKQQRLLSAQAAKMAQIQREVEELRQVNAAGRMGH